MENQIVQSHDRNINVVTAEIKNICAQARGIALTYAIEIGRRLEEAKDMLPHGEWGKWLKDEVNFSQTTANNYMRLYDEYGDQQITIFGAALNSQALGNLTYTKAIQLLAIPSEEREDFIKDNNVEKISTRELEKLIKERDAALKRAEDAEKLNTAAHEAAVAADAYKQTAAELEEESKKLKKDVNQLTEQLRQAQDEVKKSKTKIRELKNNPVIAQDILDKIRTEAEKEAAETQAKALEKQISETNKRISEAEAAKLAAEKQVEQAAYEIEELKKQITMSDPAVTEFKALFDQTQLDIERMMQALKKISEKEIAAKLRAAVEALVKQYIGGCGT